MIPRTNRGGGRRRKCAMNRAAWAVVLLGLGWTVSAGELFHCSFAQNAWSPKQWILVKSPRWNYFGGWVQRADCIENQTPAGVPEKDLLGKRAAETYTSMVLDRRFSGNITVQAGMEFTDRMAPLIVIAPVLGRDGKGRPEYREHFEVVIFDRGVNVWHHFFDNGRPSWIKAAYWRFPLEANHRYRLTVRLGRNSHGRTLTLRVAGHELGYSDPSLPREFYVGITGCEGRNRFYDFRVEN